MIFTLTPKPGAKTSGRARVFIDLIYDHKILAQISVSTQLVEQVTMVPSWNLVQATDLVSEVVDPNEITRGAMALPYVPSLDDDDYDEFEEFEGALPTFDEDADNITPISDYLEPPEPPASVEPIDADQPFPENARSRRRTAAMLRFATLSAALVLVFAVVMFVGRGGGNAPLDVGGTATAMGLIPPIVTDTPTPLPFSTEEAQAQDASLKDLTIAPLVDCAGAPAQTLVDVLRYAGYNVGLLDIGITDQGIARGTINARVVAWGACSGDTLWLYLELIDTTTPEGITDPSTVALQIPLDTIDQSDSHAVRLIGAVAEYARGGADYATLAQTFDDLAAAATTDDESAALRALQANSAAR